MWGSTTSSRQKFVGLNPYYCTQRIVQLDKNAGRFLALDLFGCKVMVSFRLVLAPLLLLDAEALVVLKTPEKRAKFAEASS